MANPARVVVPEGRVSAEAAPADVIVEAFAVPASNVMSLPLVDMSPRMFLVVAMRSPERKNRREMEISPLPSPSYLSNCATYY